MAKTLLETWDLERPGSRPGTVAVWRMERFDDGTAAVSWGVRGRGLQTRTMDAHRALDAGAKKLRGDYTEVGRTYPGYDERKAAAAAKAAEDRARWLAEPIKTGIDWAALA